MFSRDKYTFIRNLKAESPGADSVVKHLPGMYKQGFQSNLQNPPIPHTQRNKHKYAFPFFTWITGPMAEKTTMLKGKKKEKYKKKKKLSGNLLQTENPWETEMFGADSVTGCRLCLKSGILSQTEWYIRETQSKYEVYLRFMHTLDT